MKILGLVLFLTLMAIVFVATAKATGSYLSASVIWGLAIGFSAALVVSIKLMIDP